MHIDRHAIDLGWADEAVADPAWGANAWASNRRDHAIYASHSTNPEDSEP